MRKIICCLTAVIMVACAPIEKDSTITSEHGKGTGFLHPHYEDSLFQMTDDNKYSVELLIKGGALSVGNNSIDLIIHKNVEGNRDVEGSKVTFEQWMPAMGHGVLTEPVITERGAGLYSVTNALISMQGLWELRITFTADNNVHRVIFEFPDVGVVMTGSGMTAHPTHAGMPAGHMMPPDDANMSSSIKTDNGLFQASYESKPAAIPINKIHTWNLTLLNKDGVPVNDAAITVKGEMPAHMHGLPTKPIVKKGNQPGMYKANGMKFNMPGWWIIRFQIMAEGKSDTATFNLVIQ